MAWAPDYVTPAEFKDYIRLPEGDELDDAVLGLAITAASRAIDQHCHRQFGQVAAAEERRYTAAFDAKRGRWVIEIDDLMDDTGLAVYVDEGHDGVPPIPANGVAIDSVRLQPANAAETGQPWTRLLVTSESSNQPTAVEDEVVAKAKWGWTAVPDTIKQATLLQASRFFQRRNSPFGVAGSPEMGSELRLLDRVDPDVAVALSPFVRWWSAA